MLTFTVIVILFIARMIEVTRELAARDRIKR